MKDKKANIMDIARLANVGRSTVSRVINNSSLVDEETRQKVLDVMRMANYAPRAAARANRLSKTFTLAYVYGRSRAKLGEDPFNSRIFDGIADACAKNGYDLTYFYDTHESDEEKNQLSDAIRGEKVDGVIAVLGHKSETLSQLRTMSVPTLLIDPHQADICFPWIGINNSQGIRQAMQRFYDQGHRKIGYIMAKQDSILPFSFSERHKAYLLFMHEKGLPSREDWIATMQLNEGVIGVTAGYEGMKKILRSPNQPTAILAANDLIAIGVLQCLYELNLKVPSQFSIIGFDDIAAAQYTAPGLTTIRVPKEEMGAFSVKSLIGMIEKKEQKEPQCLYEIPVGLIVRGT